MPEAQTSVHDSTSCPFRSRWRICVIAALATSIFLFADKPDLSAQGTQQKDEIVQEQDVWAPFRYLSGTWNGSIDGLLGQGSGQRRYEFILDGKFLLSRHSSIRLPQDKSPDGDHHRELSIFSYDNERQKIVYRQFVVEGFVNRYTCEVEPKKFTCLTEGVENATGLRARLTVNIVDRFRFDETFELAFPGKELEVYFTNSWTRSPRLDD